MPYLSASAVVIHYEEALYQVYSPLPLPRLLLTCCVINCASQFEENRRGKRPWQCNGTSVTTFPIGCTCRMRIWRNGSCTVFYWSRIHWLQLFPSLKKTPFMTGYQPMMNWRLRHNSGSSHKASTEKVRDWAAWAPNLHRNIWLFLILIIWHVIRCTWPNG